LAVGVLDMVIGDYKFRLCPAVETTDVFLRVCVCVWVLLPFVFWPKITLLRHMARYFGSMRVQISAGIQIQVFSGWGLRWHVFKG